MNSFYKYIISFLLGIILYLVFNVKKNIEGGVFEDIQEEPHNIERINRGCQYYTCHTDPTTYDNYQKKRNPGNEKYDNCNNLSEEKYIHSNPDIIPCNNEICCENRICKSLLSESDCEGDEVFLPNKHCGYGLSNEDSCIQENCCVASNNYENYGAIFDDIITNTGIQNNLVNGGHIKKYLYDTFLDLDTMLQTETLGTLDQLHSQEYNYLNDDTLVIRYIKSKLFYITLSEKINDIPDEDLETKLILKPDIINDLSSNTIPITYGLNNKFNINGNNLTSLSLKKLIKNFDKLIIDNNLRYKPLDRFYHTSLEQNNNKHLTKNKFIALLNQ